MNQGLAQDARESGIFPKEMMKASVDEKVYDPTCLPDVDLRMTRTEWTIYWKMKYETSLAKIIEAGKVIDGAKQVIDGLRKENMRLKKMNDDLNGQIHNFQAQRQQEIVEKESTPQPKQKIKRKK